MKIYSWTGYLVCLLRGHKFAAIVLNGEQLGDLCMRCGHHPEAA